MSGTLLHLHRSSVRGRSPAPAGERSLSYHAGLDGVRGLAILAVLLYHGGVGWARGGFLGVETFFVLSGFLITSLLIGEWKRTATVRLRAFWERRARRLLPALFALVIAVGIHQALTGPENASPGLQGDGIASLLYYANWHQIVTQANYFAATGPVSPLQHTWSLAIEEQFYICWPLLFLGFAVFAARRLARASGDRTRQLHLLLVVSVIGAVASVLSVMVRYDGGKGLTRVYYGTDTRAVSILTGAILAFALALLRRPCKLAEASGGRTRGRVLELVALVAIIGVVAMMHFATGDSRWLYPDGFVVLDVAVAAVIAAVMLVPRSIVGRVFSLPPIRAVGLISYGLYLWHFPIFLWLTADSTELTGTALLLLRFAVTFTVSILSFLIIEQPVRRRRLPTRFVVAAAPVAAAGAVASVMLGSAGSTATAAGVLPAAPDRYVGNAVCRVHLADTADFGVVPMRPEKAAPTQPAWLAARRMGWSSTADIVFHTCPPKRALLIGDSLAFSEGIGLAIDEQRFGVELADAAVLGCAFTLHGDVQPRETWEHQPPECATVLGRWTQLERTFRPQVVILSLGYRDMFNWRIDGRIVHLGQPAFDSTVQGAIDSYIQALAMPGVKILVLSVPWSRPPASSDGSPNAASAPDRHARINALLRAAVARAGARARFLDIDPVIAPAGHYEARRHDGTLCRFDGTHLTIYCGRLLRTVVFGTVREMIARAHAA